MPFDPLAADLPTPRDDDPPSLRQDILDELADHLDCALRRELLTHRDDAAAAEQRVRERFGDPAAIARKLWFDALQERVMSQRFTTAALVILTLACAALFAFVWQSQAANRELAERQQATTQQLLEKLTELAKRPAAAPVTSTAPTEWNRLTVKCVYDNPGGEPVKGVQVAISGTSDRTKSIPAATKSTNADGEIDFDRWLYGDYRLLAQHNGLSYLEEFSIRPGLDQFVEVVCSRPGNSGQFQISRDLEFPIADRLWLYGKLVPIQAPREGVWGTGPGDVTVHVFQRPDGQMIAFSEQSPPEHLAVTALDVARQRPEHDPQAESLLSRRARVRHTFGPNAAWSETVAMPPGIYDFFTLGVGLTVPDDPSGNSMLSSFDVPGYHLSDRRQQMSTFRDLAGSVEVRAQSIAKWALWPPPDLEEARLAAELPDGFEVERFEISFNRGLPALADWQRAATWKSVDLLIYPDVNSYEGGPPLPVAAAAAQVLARQVQISGFGLHSPKRQQPNVEAQAGVWLFLQPSERADLRGYSRPQRFLRPTREPPRTIVPNDETAAAAHVPVLAAQETFNAVALPLQSE